MVVFCPRPVPVILIASIDHDIMQVDVLVSEPMGTLLVNERMIETYLYARDHFLKPGGKMFPVWCLPA